MDTVGSSWLAFGVASIPKIKTDNTDRNRTSPFAFTGNKFEFRMPGSSLAMADPNIVLNTAVAESLRQFADILENAGDFEAALYNLLRDTILGHRGFFNATTTPGMKLKLENGVSRYCARRRRDKVLYRHQKHRPFRQAQRA